MEASRKERARWRRGTDGSSAVAKFEWQRHATLCASLARFMLVYAVPWPDRCNVLRMVVIRLDDVCAGLICQSTAAEVRRGPCYIRTREDD